MRLLKFQLVHCDRTEKVRHHPVHLWCGSLSCPCDGHVAAVNGEFES